jgi:hypothetical protein
LVNADSIDPDGDRAEEAWRKLFTFSLYSSKYPIPMIHWRGVITQAQGVLAIGFTVPAILTANGRQFTVVSQMVRAIASSSREDIFGAMQA